MMDIDKQTGNETVTPLCPKDQWQPIGNIRSLIFIVVRDVLDGELMRVLLDTLIRKHIPLLGARIKRNAKEAALCYHLPEPFPKTYQLFGWSTDKIPSTIEEANLGFNVNDKDSASVFPDVDLIESYWAPKDWPIRRTYEKPDTPLLLVHLTQYTNATVVGMNLPHAVSDQMGFGSVIRAWGDVMRGKEPAPFLNLGPDDMSGGKDVSEEELTKKFHYRLKSRTDRIKILMGIAPELVLYPWETRRTLYLPKTAVQRIRDECNESLKAKYGPDVLLVSNGDVLAGITSKFGNLHRETPKNQLVTGPVNLRGFHPSLPQDQQYLHNAVAFCAAHVAICRSTPIEEIAYQFRLARHRVVQPEEMERNLAVTRELHNRQISMHICEPWEFSFGATNWCSAWRGIDFSVAAVTPSSKKGEADAASGKGNGNEKKLTSGLSSSSSSSSLSLSLSLSQPLVLGQSSERNHPLRLSCMIMCQAEGGYWIDLSLQARIMAKVEALLEKDPSLKTLLR